MAISEAQRRAVAKYNAANYDRVELRLEKGMKAILKEHAERHGDASLNGFINRAISETMERDKADTGDFEGV
jgi:predicted HicB family RNase H-like nuclease